MTLKLAIVKSPTLRVTRVKRCTKAQRVSISDGFASAIRDVSFTTRLSTEKLPAGAALLLRMQ
jgi:hypothetical protein